MSLRDHTAARGDTTLKADVVVVGTGPGGAAVGRALAQAGASVVYLEEGLARPNFRPNMAHTNRWHMQEGGTMIARSTQALMPIAAGRGVGGGSLVNSAICFRTPDHVLEGWTEVLGGDDRYSPEHLRPVFDEIEARIDVGQTPDAVAGENNRIIVRGAAARGHRGGLIRRNTPRCSGCGLCNQGCPVQGKNSMDLTLIPDAMALGAIVQADTRVDEILIDGGRAVGVAGDVIEPVSREVVGRLRVEAAKVFVCAGGIGTPRLLHHAGVASRLGPAVGQGLHVHPGNAVLGICDHVVKMWTGATQGAFFETDAMPGVLPHTLSAPPEALLLILGKVGADAKASLDVLPHLCGCVVMISDKGGGTVGATSAGRAAISYSFDPHDVERIKEGMVETARVLLEGGARQVLAPVHGVGVHDDADSFAKALTPRVITDFALYASHPMASCRMGADPKTSVIGADAQAHALPGLYIADSSIFPTSLGVNPQLTTMTMATAIGRAVAAAG
ncbi:MAG: GMC family oxidoreductase [Alphaproteobacteria bacterium]|nr:GMC family oxidoreductase [Alphaproteobacteria bacterium]